ncbi:MAG: hypothetical protein ACP5G6_06300 [Conexivisphaera sp.]|nr:hypothetical protein [Conexivisphaerales archaeon]
MPEKKLLPTKEIGSLRKPSWLLETLRSRKATREEKDLARDEAALVNIKLLEGVGLDYVYDGEARRIEMYEYPVRYIDGFKFAGLVRSFDNRYYKKARVVGPVRLRENYHLDEFRFVMRWAAKTPKIPVTGPYTIADWSYNEYYRDKEELAVELARNVIRPLLKELVEAGAHVIQVDEPAATTHPDEVPMFVEAFNESVYGVDADIHVHICYSGDNYRSLYPHVLNLRASHYALEFANRDTWELGVDDSHRVGYDFLRLMREYGDPRTLGLGVVDVHTDSMEPPELVRDRIIYAAKLLDDPWKLMVNPDCGLRTRSRRVALQKLETMMKGVELARAALRATNPVANV